VKSDNPLMPLSLTRTLRLKVRSEAYAWLNAAAMEVNEVFNYCNGTSYKAATRTDLKRKWLVLADSAEQRLSRSRGRDRISEDGGMRTGCAIP
jgi:hypothetical protein